MKKITLSSSIVFSENPEISFSEFEYDQANRVLLINFQIDLNNISNAQKQTEQIQTLIHLLNPAATARLKRAEGKFQCQIPLHDLKEFSTWLLRSQSTSQQIDTIIAMVAENENKQEMTSVSSSPEKKPEQGKYTTELVIHAFQYNQKQRSRHQTTIAEKKKNQNLYVLKEEPLAIFEALQGELCRLIVSPIIFAPKIRSVHDDESEQELAVISKLIAEYLSVLDLSEQSKKVLNENEWIELGAARLTAYLYAAEEDDANPDNYGIDKKLIDGKKLAPGTRLVRIDPANAGHSLIKYIHKIYGIPFDDQPVQSRSFKRSARSIESFPLHQQDIRELPNLSYATPLNWPVELIPLAKNEQYKREKYQVFLKISLITKAMLTNIGHAFASDCGVLVQKYGQEFVNKINPAFLDTFLDSIEFKNNKRNPEYRKALVCALFINHYTDRFASLRVMLLDNHEFRKYLIQHYHNYFQEIMREFAEYNNQFRANEKTKPEATTNINSVAYKTKHVSKLVNLESISKDLKDIHANVQKYFITLIQDLKLYLQRHDWKVGPQLHSKYIIDENGKPKKVTTCVSDQMQEIEKFLRSQQTASATVDKLIDLGYEAHRHALRSSWPSKPNSDSIQYYALFRDKNIETVRAGIPAAQLVSNNNNNDNNNTRPRSPTL